MIKNIFFLTLVDHRKFRKTFTLNMTHPWVYPTYWWPQYNPSLPSDEMVNMTDNIQHLDLNLQARESPPAVTSDARKVAQVQTYDTNLSRCFPFRDDMNLMRID